MTIKLSLAEETNVTLSVFNARGQLFKRLIDGDRMNAGIYNVTFDGAVRASGVYFYRLEAGPYTQMKKKILLK